MSESLEIKKAKIDSLVAGFTNAGYKSGNRLGQTELIQFLNRRSSTGIFDPIISDKLFQVIGVDGMNTITVEEFINGFLQFEEEIRKNAESFSIKLAKEEKIYAQIEDEFQKYKEEHLNDEGLSDEAKISGEITEIDIKRKLEGIKEIIIKVVYNEKSEELHFKIGDINSSEMEHKTFEFKPTSRKDHFEFIMKGVNDRNQVFDIGSKIFPLTDVNSHEEYLVQIVVPEIEDEEKIAAFIKAKIILYWSDYKYYEKRKRKAESRLKKLTVAANKAAEYLKKIREIYGDLTRKKPDLIVDFNNEKLMQKKGVKVNVNFNNVKEAEAPGGNYVVEFNNQKEVLIKQVQTKETKVEEIKEQPVTEIIPEEKLVTEPLVTEEIPNQNEYQNTFETNENINLEQYGNYEEYQTTGYEQANENITGLENTEIIKETEIRNSIHDTLIRQSLNKPLYTENTLPVIRHEKVNKVIYDTDVKTLPIIFGGKKVTYLNPEESKNFDFGGFTQEDGIQEIQEQDYTQITTQGGLTQNIQEVNNSQATQEQSYTFNGGLFDQGISGQNNDYNQIIQGEEYSQTIQGQEYTIPGGDFNQAFEQSSQPIQVLGNTQISQDQSIGFGEYTKTNY